MAVRRHLPLSFDQADINDVIVLMRAMSPEQPCGECVRITKNLREQQIMIYREATNDDAPAVAALHAESWRRNYRGVYRDEYLDGDILSERQQVWQKRLSRPDSNQFVIVAEVDSVLLGFACTYGGHDENWGSFLDNIHVHPDQQSNGLGARLMFETFSWCLTSYPDFGLYLWVLDQNHRAQNFYKGLGAVDRGGEFSEPPGGGEIHGRRYVWETVPSSKKGK